jgi:hypothetical protein
MAHNISNVTTDDVGSIPSDFPRDGCLSSLAGFQPKIAAVIHDGKYYNSGYNPTELFERWDKCEDLAVQLAKKSAASLSGKRSHMSESEILSQYLGRLIKTKWTTEAEAHWTIKRAAVILGWRYLNAEILGG